MVRFCTSKNEQLKLYYHNDNLGSPILLTNEKKEIRQTYFYGPFGNYEFKHGYVRDDVNPYQYTGQESDNEIGLMYYNDRYYDPEIGRFISEDPAAADISDPKTINRYIYVKNNPLIYTDPSGELFVIDDLIVAAVVWVAEHQLMTSIVCGVAGVVNSISEAGGNILNAKIGDGFANGFFIGWTVSSLCQDFINVQKWFSEFGKEKAKDAYSIVTETGDKAAQALKDIDVKDVDPNSISGRIYYGVKRYEKFRNFEKAYKVVSAVANSIIFYNSADNDNKEVSSILAVYGLYRGYTGARIWFSEQQKSSLQFHNNIFSWFSQGIDLTIKAKVGFYQGHNYELGTGSYEDRDVYFK